MSDNSQNVEIRVMQKEFQMMTDLLAKMDVAIDRLTQIATTAEKITAVHDQRIAIAEKNSDTIFHIIDEIRSNSAKEISENNKHISERLGQMDQRIVSLEKWRWITSGIFLLAVFIVSQLPSIIPHFL